MLAAERHILHAMTQDRLLRLVIGRRVLLHPPGRPTCAAPQRPAPATVLGAGSCSSRSPSRVRQTTSCSARARSRPGPTAAPAPPGTGPTVPRRPGSPSGHPGRQPGKPRLPFPAIGDHRRHQRCAPRRGQRRQRLRQHPGPPMSRPAPRPTVSAMMTPAEPAPSH